MPLYESRCQSCHRITTTFASVADSAVPARCEHCGGETQRIVSRPSVHRSKGSKVDRLDPKYDRMVDKAMANTQHADPDRYLRRMKPFSED